MCDGQMAQDEFIFGLRGQGEKGDGEEDHRAMLFRLRGHCPIFPYSGCELDTDDALCSVLPFCASEFRKHTNVASSWRNHDDLRT